MLRIYFLSDKSGKFTMNYLDIDCDSWSTSGTLLHVIMHDGSVRFYPLLNIESFMEVSNESQTENGTNK